MCVSSVFRWLEVECLTDPLTLRPRAAFSPTAWPRLETWSVRCSQWSWEGIWGWEGCCWRSPSPGSHAESHSWWRLYAGSHYSSHTTEEPCEIMIKNTGKTVLKYCNHLKEPFFYLFEFLNVINFVWCKAEFSASLLSVSHDPSEIILKYWCTKILMTKCQFLLKWDFYII